jgi:hypothetical protein
MQHYPVNQRDPPIHHFGAQNGSLGGATEAGTWNYDATQLLSNWPARYFVFKTNEIATELPRLFCRSSIRRQFIRISRSPTIIANGPHVQIGPGTARLKLVAKCS